MFCWSFLWGSYFDEKISYPLSSAPIDVIIPCIKKDQTILDLCIKGIIENGKNIRHIIVISPEPLTTQAEWFDEKKFPFSKRDIAGEIFKGDKKALNKFLSSKKTRIGWIYQQLLKFYAPFIIPNLSPNVLLLDADTIFLNPVEFTNELGEPLFNPTTEYHKPYFDHAKTLLPGFTKVYKEYSGISHHMLFQKCILEDLFKQITKVHHKEPWKAICNSINKKEAYGSPLSEYEIYFNFAFLRTNQSHLRFLKWQNISSIQNLEQYKKEGYIFVSCHSYLRGKE